MNHQRCGFVCIHIYIYIYFFFVYLCDVCQSPVQAADDPQRDVNCKLEPPRTPTDVEALGCTSISLTTIMSPICTIEYVFIVSSQLRCVYQSPVQAADVYIDEWGCATDPPLTPIYDTSDEALGCASISLTTIMSPRCTIEYVCIVSSQSRCVAKPCSGRC